MKAGRNKYITAIFALIIGCMPLQPLFADAPAQQPQGQNQLLQDQKQQLEQQLQQVQAEIAQYEQQLKGIQSQRNTLANKVKQLKAQQAKLTLQIQETNLRIQNISDQINQTQDQIDVNNLKIASLKKEISGMIREMYEQDHYSTLEVLVQNSNLSDFYTQVEDERRANQALSGALAQVKEVTAALNQQEQQLADQKGQQEQLVSIIGLQSVQLAGTISDQNTLLVQTKGREANYQAQLNDSRRRAAEIQGRLYDLLGVNKQVTFGQALDVAKMVSAQTGIRPAFLLAILTQESNLGKNVGTCNRAGDPPSKSWRVVMKPDRDQQPFQQITADLGLDPDITPVSCPMHDSRGNQIGWGGAMGPAQFIPSTWMGYKDRVASYTGKAANPWEIRDAFYAAAIKLNADGATSPDGEWAAAMRYFSGSTNTRYRFYGDNVMATASQYQSDIDQLNN